MKKVLATVAAASIVAAGAPAFAADVDLSGEVRVRYEQYNNFTDLDSDTGDVKDNTSQRTRLSASVKIDDQTSAKITLNDARTWGETGTTNDAADIVLNEGYLNIKNAIGPVSIKAGRQALAYGNQRLIGSLEWANQSRRFDALKLSYASEVVDVDVVASKTSNAAALAAPAKATNTSDDQLNIVYATIKNVIPVNTLDAYLIQKIGGAAEDRTNFNTVGVRLAGKAAGADWTAEVVNQAGDAKADGEDKKASAMAVTAGYTLGNVLGGLRIGGEVFAGSGQDATATDDEAFDNLYPTNHFHYGISDFSIDTPAGDSVGTGWTNNTGVAVKVSAKPLDGLTVKIEHWAMETTEDINTVGTTYESVELTETNIQVKYKLTEKTGLYAYYSIVDVDVDDADEATKLGLQLAAKF